YACGTLDYGGHSQEESKTCLRRQLTAAEQRAQEAEWGRKVAEDRLAYAEETHADYQRTAEAVLAHLRSLVERVEWGDDGYCLFCGRVKSDSSHAPDCELAVALAN